MISCQVSGLSVIPAAWASSLGMAMTVGVRARLGCRSGMIRSASASTDAFFTHAEESGTHTSGGSPMDLLSQSPARSVETSAESLALIVTDAQVPLTEGDVSAQLRASRFMIDSMRGVTTIVACA